VLVSGNDPDADRINLVYAGWNWDDLDRFLTFAKGTLWWDGHAYLTTNGFPTEAGGKRTARRSDCSRSNRGDHIEIGSTCGTPPSNPTPRRPGFFPTTIPSVWTT
jgi:hypothetical protein